MEKRGPEFYDNEAVFRIYSDHREKPENPNETMEQPLLWALIGDPGGLSVLDLGCGDARVAPKFRELGARSYLGVEGSKLMAEKAQKNLASGFSEVSLCWLEDFVPQEGAFDLVISSLALHYIEDLAGLMKKVFTALKPGGRFLFSVEHPVITSCNRSLENSALRQAWIVDDYFVRGRRDVQWMGDTVTKYHRTIEDFLNLLKQSGFQFQSLRESDPDRSQFADETLWSRRRRIPLFLTLAASKN